MNKKKRVVSTKHKTLEIIAYIDRGYSVSAIAERLNITVDKACKLYTNAANVLADNSPTKDVRIVAMTNQLQHIQKCATEDYEASKYIPQSLFDKASEAGVEVPPSVGNQKALKTVMEAIIAEGKLNSMGEKEEQQTNIVFSLDSLLPVVKQFQQQQPIADKSEEQPKTIIIPAYDSANKPSDQ